MSEFRTVRLPALSACRQKNLSISLLASSCLLCQLICEESLAQTIDKSVARTAPGSAPGNTESWAKSDHPSLEAGLREVFRAFQITSNAWDVKPKFEPPQLLEWQTLVEQKDPQAICLLGIKQVLDAEAAGDKEKRQAGLDQVLMAANAGDPTAQFFCSRAYLSGFGLEQNSAEAMKWARRSAEQNYPHANYAVGSIELSKESELLSRGKKDDVSALHRTALEYFQKSAETGSALGMLSAGILSNALGDKQQALMYFSKSADLGNGQASYRLGNELLSGANLPRDEAKAFVLLLRSAETGNENAMFAISRLYLMGVGTDPDEAEFHFWLERAASLGQPASMRVLGHLKRGKDDIASRNWFLKAAMAGDPEAMGWAGGALIYGFGGPKDVDQGLAWLRRGLEQKDRYAAFLLGVCYDEAMGVQKNLEEAFKHFLMAAELGMPQAMTNVGTCYIDGKGIKRDEQKAVEWYRRAIEAKELLAIDNLIETLREQPRLAKGPNEIQELIQLRSRISKESVK